MDFVITLCFVFLYSDQATASILSPQGHISMAALSPLFSATWNKLVLVCDADVHFLGGDQQQMMWHLPLLLGGSRGAALQPHFTVSEWTLQLWFIFWGFQHNGGVESPHSQTVWTGHLMTVSLRGHNSSADARWSAPLEQSELRLADSMIDKGGMHRESMSDLTLSRHVEF